MVEGLYRGDKNECPNLKSSVSCLSLVRTMSYGPIMIYELGVTEAWGWRQNFAQKLTCQTISLALSIATVGQTLTLQLHWKNAGIF